MQSLRTALAASICCLHSCSCDLLSR